MYLPVYRILTVILLSLCSVLLYGGRVTLTGQAPESYRGQVVYLDILVAPLGDGSLRFLQVADSPGWLRSGGDAEGFNSATIEAFENELEENPQVIEFFTQPGVL